MAQGLLGPSTYRPLEDQIRQRWGRYGDWQSADQNQVADLARLLEANGITDLSQLQFSKRDYTRPVTVRETESGSQTDGGDTRTTFDVRYGDRDLGFLGDINRDGSVSVSGRGELTDRGDAGPILGWSSRGGGNTNYRLVEDPKTGQVVVVPTWGSSKTGSLQDARAAATIAAMAYGGYLYDGGASAMSGLDSAMIDMGAGATNVGAAEVGSGGLMEAMGGTSAVEAGGGSLSKAALYGAEGYGPGMTGAQTSIFDTVAGLTGSNQLAAGAADMAGLLNGAGNMMDLGTLAKLAGAIYGAQQSKDRTQTSTQTHDPWAPAQPYLLAQLGNVAKLQEHYQANPINDIQKGAANQKLGLLSALNSQVLPGLLSGMGTLSAGYQRPGGPAPRPSGMNYDPSALLTGMQGNNVDWSRMFPKG